MPPVPLLELPTSGVHLWMAAVDDPAIDEARMAAYRAWLSPGEAAQGSRYVFEKDRRRHLVTRALVRSVLSRYSRDRRPPQDWAFEANEYGCPHVANPLEGMSPVVFNLSHTDTRVVMAVRAGLAVGVDIEAWDRRINLDIADHFFSRDEVTALRALPEAVQRERFMELWTFKESYIKARKMGLSIPLDGFGFEMAGTADVALVLAPVLKEGDTPERWAFFQLRPGPDHVVALCAERGPGAAHPPSIEWYQWVPGSPSLPVRVECGVSRMSMPSLP